MTIVMLVAMRSMYQSHRANLTIASPRSSCSP